MITLFAKFCDDVGLVVVMMNGHSSQRGVIDWEISSSSGGDTDGGMLCFCAEGKRRSRDESRHREEGRTDEISVLSLLSSYLRWEVSKEGQLSYPNFVRGLLLDDMQSLVSRFEILGVLCCTINEVPRRLRNQKEAGLCNPWNSVMWRKSKRGVFAQSVSFRDFFER